jgi:predicted secreted Zn-dependent protease
MKIALTPFCVMLAVIATPALALEKCVGADGKVYYSDRACPAGAKRTTVGGDSSMTGAQIEYYDVQAPGGHQGTASWNMSYTYRTRTAPGSGCAVDSVATKLDLKVRLPRWSPPAGASPDLSTRWERYMDALRVHENGHLQTGRDLESNFKRAASGIVTADCGALGTALRASFDSLLRQANQRDKDYDAQTGHGATQGAVFK